MNVMGVDGRIECGDIEGRRIDICLGTPEGAIELNVPWEVAEVKKAGYSNLKDGRSYLRMVKRQAEGQFPGLKVAFAEPGKRSSDMYSGEPWPSGGSFSVGIVDVDVEYWYAPKGRSETGSVYQYTYSFRRNTSEDDLDEALDIMLGEGASSSLFVPGMSYPVSVIGSMTLTMPAGTPLTATAAAGEAATVGGAAVLSAEEAMIAAEVEVGLIQLEEFLAAAASASNRG